MADRQRAEFRRGPVGLLRLQSACHSSRPGVAAGAAWQPRRAEQGLVQRVLVAKLQRVGTGVGHPPPAGESGFDVGFSALPRGFGGPLCSGSGRTPEALHHWSKNRRQHSRGGHSLFNGHRPGLLGPGHRIGLDRHRSLHGLGRLRRRCRRASLLLRSHAERGGDLRAGRGIFHLGNPRWSAHPLVGLRFRRLPVGARVSGGKRGCLLRAGCLASLVFPLEASAGRTGNRHECHDRSGWRVHTVHCRNQTPCFHRWAGCSCGRLRRPAAGTRALQPGHAPIHGIFQAAGCSGRFPPGRSRVARSFRLSRGLLE